MAIDLKEVRSGYPFSVWDGTSQDRVAGDATNRDAVSGSDRVQLVAEIIKLQQVVLYLADLVDVALVAPVVSAFGAPDAPGLEATFTVDASMWISGIIHWGDGASTVIEGGETSFTHAYGDPGTYSIEVTATNLIGTTNQTFSTEIADPPS